MRRCQVRPSLRKIHRGVSTLADCNRSLDTARASGRSMFERPRLSENGRKAVQFAFNLSIEGSLCRFSARGSRAGARTRAASRQVLQKQPGRLIRAAVWPFVPDPTNRLQRNRYSPSSFGAMITLSGGMMRTPRHSSRFAGKAREASCMGAAPGRASDASSCASALRSRRRR